MLAAIGAVMTIVPVGVVQFGCMVTVAVGVGTEGIALIIRESGTDMQPVAVFCVVTL